MTWRLVRGAIYIQRWSLLAMTAMVGFSSRLDRREWLTAGLVTVMAGLAGLMARWALSRRELASLPVAPREWHRAEWLLTALLPIALLTIGRLLGGGGQGESGPRVLFDIVYFSLVGAWCVRTPEDPSLPRLFFGTVAAMAIPFVVIHRLPLVLDGVSTLLWICALVLLGVGVRPLISPPFVYTRSSPAVASEPPPLPLRLQPPTTPGPSARLEGMWVPMRGVVGHALLGTTVMLIFLAISQHLEGVVTIWSSFDSSMTELRFLSSLRLPVLLTIGLGPSLAPWIGALKRLPLSSRRAALLLSLAPTTMPVALWVGLLSLQLLVATPVPDTLRLSQLTMFIGVVSLIDALGTKSGSGLAKMTMGFVVSIPAVYGMAEHPARVEAMLASWGLPLAGVLCLSLAWVVNFHTLTRSPGSARAFQIGRPTNTAGAR